VLLVVALPMGGSSTHVLLCSSLGAGSGHECVRVSGTSVRPGKSSRRPLRVLASHSSPPTSGSPSARCARAWTARCRSRAAVCRTSHGNRPRRARRRRMRARVPRVRGDRVGWMLRNSWTRAGWTRRRRPACRPAARRTVTSDAAAARVGLGDSADDRPACSSRRLAGCGECPAAALNGADCVERLECEGPLRASCIRYEEHANDRSRQRLDHARHPDPA
jgi:hypothetical protein